MAERFDIVVAGAGHNSLIAAAYLAKRAIAVWCSRDGRSWAAASSPRN